MSTNNDWILMSERRPTQADFPLWIYDARADGNARGPFIRVAFTVPDHWTHWKRHTDIPAPPREKTQEDKDNDALLEWIGALGLPPTNVCVWEAALAYERAEVFKLLPDSDEIMIKGGQALNNYKALIARCGGGK